MGRRIWIVAEKKKVTEADKVNAKAHNCPEIINGIPPALKNSVFNSMLPFAYEEPDPPLPQPPRNLAQEIDEIKAKLGI